MKQTMRILSISRPMALIACVLVYILDARVTDWHLALYVVSAAFFLASSAVTNGWIESTYRWQFWTTFAELVLIAYLNWHSLWFFHNNAISVGFTVSIVSIPLTLERKWWRTGITLLVVLWTLTTVLGMWGHTLNEHLLVMVIYGAALMLFGGTGVMTQNLKEERNRSRQLLSEVTHSRAALERAHRQLQESAASQQHLAVLEERQRLAREIHDSVAHGLTALVVQMQAARKLMDRDPARALETVARCEEMAREALQETRRAVRALHPSGLEQQSDVEALKRLARDYGIATNMQVEVRADVGALAMPPSSARLEQLYRIFQEALTNAHRHGEAKNVTADLSVSGTILTMTIANDGLPPTNLDPGVGLKSMAERIHSIGGEIAYIPGGVGLTIQVTVPVYKEVAG
ncbi:MAG TPA: sensor histidine kinase [Symbiobacteriaceae bacterium]|nr:sensor histidine kinase [Symbiobacteriaceae bacterium]